MSNGGLSKRDMAMFAGSINQHLNQTVQPVTRKDAELLRGRGLDLQRLVYGGQGGPPNSQPQARMPMHPQHTPQPQQQPQYFQQPPPSSLPQDNYTQKLPSQPAGYIPMDEHAKKYISQDEFDVQQDPTFGSVPNQAPSISFQETNFSTPKYNAEESTLDSLRREVSELRDIVDTLSKTNKTMSTRIYKMLKLLEGSGIVKEESKPEKVKTPTKTKTVMVEPEPPQDEEETETPTFKIPQL